MRRPQRPLAPGRVALRLYLRGAFPPRGDHPGPLSRYCLVLDYRRGVAGAEGGLRALARAGELRRAGAAENAAQRAHGGGAGRRAPAKLIHPDPDRGAAIFPAAQIPSRGHPHDREVPDRLPSTTGCASPDTLRSCALDLS